ncbi:MAG: hypothetical protein HYU66_06130, partial [Armatimonadetes bacterium]|nr:hypothetical protein [Armatimonadota bacterium]
TIANDTGPYAPGALYYAAWAEVGARPVLEASCYGSLAAGAPPRELEFVTDPGVGGGQVQLRVLTLTDGPAGGGGAPRRVALEQCWQAWPLSLPVISHRVGPLDTDAECLLFGQGIAEPDDPGPVLEFQVRNWGDQPALCEAQCSDGFQLMADDPPGWTPSGRVRVTAGLTAGGHPQPGTKTVSVQWLRDPNHARGALTLKAAGTPDVRVELDVIEPAVVRREEKRYTVGIDFGTSKTAVAWVDNEMFPPVPTVMQWPRLPRSDGPPEPDWVPSAVLQRPGSPTLFGDHALRGDPGVVGSDVGVRLRGGRLKLPDDRGTLYVGMKMFLLLPPPDDDPDRASLLKAVADFFQFVFETIREKTPVDLSEARLVISVPVKDGREDYDEQAKLTRQAVVVACGRLGLDPEQLVFEKEPVCAAIDVIRQLRDPNGTGEEGPLPVPPGEWMGVFDSGAGTTDVTFLQISDRDGELTFDRVEVLGFDWGGDQIDVYLYEDLMDLWVDAEGTQDLPHGPVAIRPAEPPPEGADTTTWSYANWMSYMNQVERLQFTGARRALSKGELLGCVSRAKEELIRGEGPPAEVTSRAPLEHLPPDERGQGPWRGWDLKAAADRHKFLIAQMSDHRDPRILIDRLAELRGKVGLSGNTLVAPVGGNTLLPGWRPSMELPEISLRPVPEPPDLGLRRLHVVRGAAQYSQVQVLDRLPAPLRLEALSYTPWSPGAVLAGPGRSKELAAGSPPGETSWVMVTAPVSLTPGSYVRVRAVLGERVLRQVEFAWHEAAAALHGRGITRTPNSLSVEVKLSYLAGPKLGFASRWLLANADVPAAQASPVRLPRLEG